MSTVMIRYNTKAADNDPMKWRVIIDGVESLADEVIVQGVSRTSTDVIEGGLVKHHVSVNDADVIWVGKTAFVRSKKPDFEVFTNPRGVQFRIGNQCFMIQGTGIDDDPLDSKAMREFYVKMLNIALGSL
jgi:hypothetical protein